MNSLRTRYQQYWFAEIFEFFSKKDHFQSFTLNLLGIYALRTAYSRILAKFGRVQLRRKVAPELRKEIRRNGYLVIENFYGAEDFSAIKQACYELLVNEQRVQIQDRNGARRRVVHVNAKDLQIEKVVSDPRIRRLFSYGLGQSLAYDEIAFRIWSVCTTSPYGKDENQNTHADTSYPAVKAWLYLDDCKSQDGAFNYTPGSHRWSLSRIVWEYVHALQGGNRDVIWRVSDEDLRRYKFEPIRELDVKANSLVIADVSGFHRRGTAPIGLERDTVFITHVRAPCKLRRIPLFGTSDATTSQDIWASNQTTRS